MRPNNPAAFLRRPGSSPRLLLSTALLCLLSASAVSSAPRILSFEPSSGEAGSMVTISGSDLQGVHTVVFNGTPTPAFSTLSSSEIAAVVPEYATDGRIRLMSEAGSVFSAEDFRVLPTPAVTSVFPPTADAFVKTSNSAANYGAEAHLRVRGSEDRSRDYRSYLKFELADIAGSVEAATLRLYVTDGSDQGGDLYLVGSDWDESTINWDNAPSVGGTVLASGSAVAAGAWVAFDVSSAISGDGTYSFVLVSSSSNSVYYESREGASAPELVVTSRSGVPVGPPVLTSFSPTTGLVGTSVSLVGTDFQGVSEVAFGGTPSVFLTESDTEIVAEVPAHASVGPIRITNSAGNAVSSSDFVRIREPAISTFAPSGGLPGDEIVVSGTGFAGASSVLFGEVFADAFTVHSDNRITVSVPSGAETAPILVLNAAGTSVSSASFQVLTPILVDRVIPLEGTVGTTVAFLGTGFAGVSSVVFNGVPSAGYTVHSDSIMTAVVPADATTGEITLATLGLATVHAADFVVIQPPVIAGFEPAAAPVDSEVTISGTGFTGVALLSFGHAGATSFTVESDSVIVARVPSGATVGKITLQNAAGTASSADDFLTVSLPSISSFDPPLGPVGAEVVISGEGFLGVHTVLFNGTPAPTFFVESDSRMTAFVPEFATSGSIRATNVVGTAESATQFEVETAPSVVTTFLPIADALVKSGSPDRNFGTRTELQVRGSPDGLKTVRSFLKFEVTGMTGGAESATLRLRVTDPSPQGGDLHLVSNDWSESLVTWNNGPIVYSTPLGVMNSVTDGAWVEFDVTSEITGDGTYSFALLSSSTNSALYSSREGTSPPQLDVISREGFPTGPPELARFSPPSGLVGAEIELLGSNFEGVNEVTFGGVASEFTVSSDVRILTRVPAGAGTGRVTVATAAGRAVSESDFLVLSVPVIHSFEPASGVPGITVTIRGSGFRGVSLVSFNGSPTSAFSVLSDSIVVAAVPAEATVGKISFSNAIGRVESATDFTPLFPPMISSVDPAGGRIGSEVTILGGGFLGVHTVVFQGAPASFSVVSDVEITAVVPSYATSGRVRVANDAGTAWSPDEFRVGTATTHVTNADALVKSSNPGRNYGSDPELRVRGSSDNTRDIRTYLRFDVSGSTASGDGARLRLYVTDPSSDGGDLYLVSNDWSESTLSWDHAPALTGPVVARAGGVAADTWIELDVSSVVTGDGTYSFALVSSSTNSAYYSSREGSSPPELVVGAGEQPPSGAPLIAGFQPSSGPIGTEVELDGANFAGVASVTVGRVPALFTILSDTRIRVSVPAGASTGQIAVTNSIGTTISGPAFFVVEVPEISFFTPSSGVPGSDVTITGANCAEVTSVFFNGTAATFTVESDALIMARVPSGATMGKIRLSNSAGMGETPTEFMPIHHPVVISIEPESSHIGGVVKISGTGFLGTHSVSFNGMETSDIWVESDNQIVAVVPDLATDGRVRVTNDAGSSLSTDHLRLGGGTYTFFSIADAKIKSEYPDGNNGKDRTLRVRNYLEIDDDLDDDPDDDPTEDDDREIIKSYLKFKVSDLELPDDDLDDDLDTDNDEIEDEERIVSITLRLFVTDPSNQRGRVWLVNNDWRESSITWNNAPPESLLLVGAIRSTRPAGFYESFFIPPSLITDNGKYSFVLESNSPNSAWYSSREGTNPPELVVLTVPIVPPPPPPVDPPQISSFSPASGLPGMEISLYGSNFEQATEVFIGGMSSTFTVQSDTWIIATVPDGVTTGRIAITNAAGTAVSGIDFLVVAPPEISAFTPFSGIAGRPVTISGSGFSGVSVITFGGVPASIFTVQSDSLIVAEVPLDAVTGRISLSSAVGAVQSAQDFHMIHEPVVGAFDPPMAWPGGEVTISGSNFYGVHTLVFNGTPASRFTVVSDSLITARVPVFATNGRIRVMNDAGAASSTEEFQVDPSAVVSSTTPLADAVVNTRHPDGNFGSDPELRVRAPGDNDRIYNSYLKFEVAGIEGRVDSAVLQLFVVDDSHEGGDVHLVSDDWSETGITWNNAPPIGGTMVASAGAVQQGVWIELDVSSMVTENGTYSFGMVGPSSISARYSSREGASPPRLVVISSEGPPSPNPPAITSFGPLSGAAGSEIEILGTGFAGASTVTFGGTPSIFVVESTDRILAQVPSGAGSGTIAVTNAAGTAVSPSGFLVILPPAIDSFSPSLGVPGTEVAISGSGLTGVSSVGFGEAPAASFTVTSDSLVVASVPQGAPTGVITVTNVAGESVSADSFRVFAPVVVNSFEPPAGPVGTEVTFRGAGFTQVTAIAFQHDTAEEVTVHSDSVMTAIVPQQAVTGAIRVESPAVKVTTEAIFSVIRSPVVAQFDPVAGPVGTEVTITGSGFVGVSSVSFQGIEATAFSVGSDSVLTAEVPEGASTGKISVTNPVGTALSSIDYAVIGIPSITSFTPEAGPVGTSVAFVGTGFASVSSVFFDGVPAEQTTVHRDSVMTATVPPGATTGSISLVSPAGAATTTTEFVVIQLPTIARFDPASGPVGTEVTVIGTGFTGVEIVTLDGTEVAAFTVHSDSVLVAEVPAGATSGRISLRNSAGTGVSTADFSVIEIPTIAAFEPTSGVPETWVSIHGTGLHAVAQVTFNGVEASAFAPISDVELAARVPVGATSGKIRVTNAAGEASSASDFTVYQAPVILAIDPASGIPGSWVTLTGDGFTGVSSVRFGAVDAAAFHVESDSSINAQVPESATSGKIEVANVVGAAESPIDYLVIGAPGIHSIDPPTGAVGTEVTITGTGFGSVSSILFSGVAVDDMTVLSDSVMTTIVPAGATSGPLGLRTPAGVAETPVEFVVIHVPVVSHFAPTLGPAGTEVTLTGTGFTGVEVVTFGATPASFTTSSDSVLVAEVPQGATTGSIRLTNEAGTALTVEEFAVVDVPQLVSFAPLSGPRGTTVTMHGANFTGVNVVEFGGVAATSVSVLSDSLLTAEVPPGATTGAIRLENPAGASVAPAAFTVILPPDIVSFAPIVGPVGTTITIAGSGFIGVTDVTLNGLAVGEFAVVSDSEITAEIPAGAESGPLALMNPAGQSSTQQTFTVVALPTITSFEPSSGIAGTWVTVQGTGLELTLEVTFNGVAASAFAALSDTELAARVPAGATSGEIRVANAAGVASGAGDFTVFQTPAILTIEPASGIAGSWVTIAGSGFTGVSSVRFGGIDATGFQVEGDSLINARVPESANTGRIEVANLAGAGASPIDYTVIGAPGIDSFAPPLGVVGTEVTISGSGFTAVTFVSFDGVAADSMTVHSDSVISAIVPEGATTGEVVARNEAGAAVSTTLFVVIQEPAITSLAPDHGVAGATVAILGSGLTGVSSVSFHGVEAPSFTVFSDSVMSAVVPEDATSGAVAVANAAGVALSTSPFHVIAQPVITGFDPPLAIPGTTVTVTGRAFTGVGFVTFNGTPTPGFHVLADSVITAVVPEGTTSGPIGVTNAVGTAASSESLLLVQPPVIASLAEGHEIAGTRSLTIAGSGLLGTHSVTLAGVEVPSFVVASDSIVTAEMPDTTLTGTVIVTNLAGSFESAEVFSTVRDPWITSFEPSVAVAGAEVTIRGERFSTATRVTFGDVEAAGFQVVSDAEIRVELPAGATTGLIHVTNPGGTGTSDVALIVPVRFEQRTRGGGDDETVISTSEHDSGGIDQLYLAAIASKPVRSVTNVTGLGLSWQFVKSSERADKTAIEIWMASGTSAGGSVTATFEDQARGSSIVVCRYSGANLADPIGGTVFGSRDDPGAEVDRYSLDIGTTAPGSVIFGAATMRTKSHTPGTGYTEKVDWAFDAGGDMTRIALQEKLALEPGTYVLDGVFSGATDWAVIGLELVAAPLPTVQAPDLAAAPFDPAGDSGSREGTDGDAEPETNGKPVEFRVYRSFPNPFRSATSIQFDLPEANQVDIRIYDVTGRLVRVLGDSRREPGQHLIRWDGRSDSGRRVAAGIYFYRVSAGEFTTTESVTVLR